MASVRCVKYGSLLPLLGFVTLDDCVITNKPSDIAHGLGFVELICQAITAYKDYVMALHQGAQYHFMEDIWPVGGGKMNAII